MNCYLNKKAIKGFTLVELLISMSIIAFMAGMSISAYPKFSEQINLTGETYKILAYFKETQTFGVSTLAKPGVKFIYAFAIDKNSNTITRVKIENPTDKTNKYYIDNSQQDFESDLLTIKDKYEIASIEGILGNSTTTLDKAYSFYKRPNPESRIIGLIGQNLQPDVNMGSYTKLYITLRSKKDNNFFKKVVVLQTGQVYVEDW